jgi:hypothetical protein
MEPRTALIRYQLSEIGRREAVKRGLTAARQQEQGGVITLPEDVDLFKLDSDGQLARDLPGPPLDDPPENFEAALQLLRRRNAEEAEFLGKQRRATGRLPTVS